MEKKVFCHPEVSLAIQRLLATKDRNKSPEILTEYRRHARVSSDHFSFDGDGSGTPTDVMEDWIQDDLTASWGDNPCDQEHPDPVAFDIEWSLVYEPPHRDLDPEVAANLEQLMKFAEMAGISVDDIAHRIEEDLPIDQMLVDEVGKEVPLWDLVWGIVSNMKVPWVADNTRTTAVSVKFPPQKGFYIFGEAERILRTDPAGAIMLARLAALREVKEDGFIRLLEV